MNDKEELKEIERLADEFNVAWKNTERDKMSRVSHELVFSHVEWLIEKAREVRALERAYDRRVNVNANLVAKNRVLKEQNKRYKEALNFYRSGKHFECITTKFGEEFDVVSDYGEVAFKSLEE